MVGLRGLYTYIIEFLGVAVYTSVPFIFRFETSAFLKYEYPPLLLLRLSSDG